jgi:uncharacterized protein
MSQTQSTVDSQLVLQLMQNIKAIVHRVLADQPVKVYLFGSRARGDASRVSDVDLAIEEISPMNSYKYSELAELLEESTIPYRVDIVNLNAASSALQSMVKKEGVLWKDYNND